MGRPTYEYIQQLIKAVTIMVSLITKNITIPLSEAISLQKIYTSMIVFEKQKSIKLSDSLKPLIDYIEQESIDSST